MLQHLEVLYNSVHQIFQIANAGCDKIMHEWKIHSKCKTNRPAKVHW